MAVRILPKDYFKSTIKPQIKVHEAVSDPIEMQTEPQYIEVPVIPEWVPILLGIALAGTLIVSIYAISKIK